MLKDGTKRARLPRRKLFAASLAIAALVVFMVLQHAAFTSIRSKVGTVTRWQRWESTYIGSEAQRYSQKLSEERATVAAVLIVRSSRFPQEAVAGLTRTRGAIPFEIVVVTSSAFFDSPSLNAGLRAFDLLVHRVSNQSLCQASLVVLRSTNDSLPTYGEMCSAGEKQASASVTHVLFLSEAHVPRDVHFLKRMLEPFSLSASPAWGVQCAIVEGTGDGAAPVDGEPLRSGVIVDHGLELSETVNHVDAPLAAVRRLRGFSVRDARLRRATRVHLISPYCSMWDRSKYSLIGGVRADFQSCDVQALEGKFSDTYVPSLMWKLVGARRVLERLALNVSVDEVVREGGVLLESLRMCNKALAYAYSRLEFLGVSARFGEDQIQSVMLPSPPPGLPKGEQLAYVAQELYVLAERLENASYTVDCRDETLGWEMSLKTSALGGTVYAAGNGIAQFQESLVPASIRRYLVSSRAQLMTASLPLTSKFLSSWRSVADTLLRASGALHSTRIIWESICCGCCGFSAEITHFVVPLSRRYELQTYLTYKCFCDGYPTSVVDALSRAFVDKYTSTTTPDPRKKTLLVFHTSPGMFRNETGAYLVGRSMYEFSRIEQKWVDAIANVNEVWVPAKFVATAFAISGVPKEKLLVIPEAVDTYFFDPDVQDAVPLPLDGPRAKRWFHYCNSDHSSVAASPRAFKFFSNFKWEPRKGWETLFEAYWRAFGSLSRSERPVSLYILTYYFFNSKSGDIHNVSLILDELTQWAKAKLHVESLAEFPHFCIITETITETELAGLYKSADAFVLPTRGEGWCLPAIEAMSMGLPTIATAWGGQTEFMTRDNSFLILPDAVEEPPEDNMYGFQLGKKWATPSMNHTAQLMQYVYSHPVHAKRVGERARRHIEEHFSEEAVAAAVEAHVELING